MRELAYKTQALLYHDVILPEEAKAIRAEVREFTEREIEPVACEIDRQEESRERFPRGIFAKMAGQGLFQIPYPKEYGGRGLSYPICSTTVAIEELAYASNSMAAIYDVHSILAGHSLMYGSEELKKRYLVPAISGEKVACFAITEPDAGSDLSINTIKTYASKKGSKWVINGRKRFIINAPVGDFASTLCVTDGSLSMIVVDLHSKGVTIGEPDKKMGIKACLTADVCFGGVEVPEGNLIGEAGRGMRIALGALTCGRIAIGVTGVAMAQAAFDECVAYMKKRKVFGKKLAQFQYWQFKLAERATQIENARNLCYKTAYRYDQGVNSPEPETAMAKYYGTQLAGDMARDAVQIFGGYGFMSCLAADESSYKVERIYRDCKAAEIYEGSNEIQKWAIARQIFGKELAV